MCYVLYIFFYFSFSCFCVRCFIYLILFLSQGLKIGVHKSRFTQYDSDACDKLTTSLRHDVGPFTRARHFHLQIKYAKVCTGIYRAKFLTNGKENILAVLRFKKKISNEMFFAVIRSFRSEKRLHVNQSTTTSSAILAQENFTFVPYSVEICHKIRHFLSISATIVAAF